MFTGLIEDLGRIVKIGRSGDAAGLVVASGIPTNEVRIGDSIAVQGACLTVVSLKGSEIGFDLSPETMEKTAFRFLTTGSPVNLERALRLSDRLGGHIVTGHVDCLATLSAQRNHSGNLVLTFSLPPHFERYIVSKGSITVDGVSLTVNEVYENGFSINLIPHSASKTTLSGLTVGTKVNIEVDILAKYLERLMGGTGNRPGSEGLTLDLLAKNGFL